MNEDWADPTDISGDRLNPRDIIDHLLIIWPIEYVAHSPTVHSRPDRPSDLIIVDVVDLDQPDENGFQGALYQHVWWRQSRLIAKCRDRIGQRLLCYMTKAAPKPGFNPAFELLSAKGDAEALARGEAWIKAHPNFQPSVPGTRAPAPSSDNGGQWQSTTNTNTTPVPDPQKSWLEQFAQQPARGAARLPLPPPPPPQPDAPGF